ncbi:peptidylprolyl isomerase [Desulfurispira natronophila]|nr:peptidylprolyl isomerase [Desulfurispira natronophila]
MLAAIIAFLLIFSVSAQAEAYPSKEDAGNPVAHIVTSMGEIYAELYPQAAPQTVQNFIELSRTGFYEGLEFHQVVVGSMIRGGDPTGTGSGGPGYTFADEINASALGLDQESVVQEGYLPHPALGIGSQADFQQQILIPLIQSMGILTQHELELREHEVEQQLMALSLKEAYENLGYSYRDDLPSRHPVAGSLAMANSGPDSNGSQFVITLEDAPWLAGKHTVFGQVLLGMEVVERICQVSVDIEMRPRLPVIIENIEIVDDLPPEPEEEPEA